MDLTIEMMPPYRIAFIRRTGPYGRSNTQTMEALKNWARTNGLLNDKAVVLGVAQDNPETTRPENCRYDTCIVIGEDYRLTGGCAAEGRIRGGKYAVFDIGHTAEAVQEAWMGVFTELTGRGYAVDLARPVIERYAAGKVSVHRCELCVPVL